MSRMGSERHAGLMRGGQTVSALRSAVAMPWRAHRGIFVGMLAITLAGGLVPVAAAWLLRTVFDSLTTGRSHPSLLVLVLALAVTNGMQGMLPAASQYLAAQYGPDHGSADSAAPHHRRHAAGRSDQRGGRTAVHPLG